MRGNKLQTAIATGRFTLPVTICLCLLLWMIAGKAWSEIASLCIVTGTIYLMFECSSAFTLFRTRTTFHVCFYLFLATVLFFLHPFQWMHFTVLACAVAIFQLFLSYEAPTATVHVFHLFLALALGSLAFPPLLYFSPLFLIGMVLLRSCCFKSLLAGLVGLLAPYWFLFGYAFLTEQMPVFYAPWQELVRFLPLRYDRLTMPEWGSWGYITGVQVVSSLHYLRISYQDNIRPRVCFQFLNLTGFWALVLNVLQPQYLYALLPIQLFCTAFLTGHLFTLTRNRFSGIYFVVTFVGFILLTLYNLWMRFFSF